MLPGLAEGLLAGGGAPEGSARRLVIPSKLGYNDRSAVVPLPRDWGRQQRLFSTVLNSVRTDQERAALGDDLVGVIVVDVEVRRVRGRKAGGAEVTGPGTLPWGE